MTNLARSDGHHWKIVALLGWSAVCLMLLAGAGKNGELRARRLVIEDEKGRECIVLDSSQGESSIHVKSATEGHDGLRFSVFEADSYIHVCDPKNGHATVALSPFAISVQGRPLRMGLQPVEIGVTEEDEPFITLSDSKGKVIGRLPPPKDGRVKLPVPR